MELRESGEDYLEAILNIETTKGVVRSVDVANHLGVSKPSVSRAMGVLKNAGYIEQETYGDISLTEKGRERAKGILKRHITLTAFFTDILGVNKETASEDACRVEHVLSQETMDKLTEFLNKSK